MIDGIQPALADLRSLSAKKASEAHKASELAKGDETSASAEADDRVSLGTSAAAGTYRKPSVMEGTLEARLAVLRDLVARTFEKQGLSYKIDVGGGRTASLEDLTPQEAGALVSDDGYWGVEKTSQRIADFAIQAAGNDPGKLDTIRQAVLKGFGMARQAFGGSLPEVSQKTLDAAMSRLDDWAKSQSAAG
jgi:hypothetical protein